MGNDVTRRLNELFADPELRREQLRTAAELEAAGTDWGDERWEFVGELSQPARASHGRSRDPQTVNTRPARRTR